MKKLLKGLCALLLAASCVTSLPVMDVEAEGISYIDVDTTGWSGTAVDKNGTNVEFSSGKGTDGPVEYMFDTDSSTIFHTSNAAGNDWDKVAEDNFPVSIEIDLNGEKTFGAFYLENRNHGDNKDDVTEYKLYILENDEWVEVSSNVGGNKLTTTTNTVNLDKNYTTTKVKLEVHSTTALDQNASSSWIVIKNFKLMETLVLETLDRSNWDAKSYAYNNQEEFNDLSNTSEGNPNFLFDGNNSTFWHTDYTGSDQNNITTPPYYVVIDLDENGDGSVSFDGFSWVNRGHVPGVGANGIVENFRFYYATDDSVTLPLTEAGTASEQNIDTRWINATDLIVGKNADVDYATMRWNSQSASNLTVNDFLFNQEITASKVMIEVVTSKNAISKQHGCGVEFNLLKKSTSGLPRGAYGYFYDGTANIATDEGGNCTYGGLIDGNTTGFWHSAYSGGLPSNDYKEQTNLNNDTKVSVELQKPMYLLINLGEDTTFDQFTYVNRPESNDMNGIVTQVNLYANLGNAPLTITQTTGTQISLANWDYVTTGYLNPGSNTVDFEDAVTTNQVLVEITHVLPNWGGALVAVCLDFSVAKRADDAQMAAVNPFAAVSWDKAPYSANNAGLLDSFYSAMVLNTPNKDTAVEAGDNVYARYVSAKVGTVKAQAKVDGDYYKLRFVSSVASLNPTSAGFEVSVDGRAVKDVPCNVVFESIEETDGTAVTTSTAAQAFDNDASAYFTTFTISKVPTDGTANESVITITPYWTVKGSDEKVYGTQRSITVGDILAQTPNITNAN